MEFSGMESYNEQESKGGCCMYIYWEDGRVEVAEMETVITGCSDHFKICSQIEKNGKPGENERGWSAVFVHTSVFPTVSFNCPFNIFLFSNAFNYWGWWY